MLLHGFTGRGASWLRTAVDLGESRRFILPDLPGHGESSAPGDVKHYRMESAAAYLAILVEYVAVEPVHLVGYSMGGRLALYFTLAYPQLVRSLVLESASPGLESAAEREARRVSDDELADKILAEGMEAFVNHWEALPLFASQSSLPVEVQLTQRQQRLANDPLGLAGSLRGMSTGVQPSLWERLDELDCPVSLVVGELDTKFLTINQRMKEKVPHASLTVIPGAGHTPHLEQPALFNQLVRAFWDGLPSNKDLLHP